MALAKEDVTIKGLDDTSMEFMSIYLKNDLTALTEYKTAMENASRGSPKISLLSKWLPCKGSHFDKKLSFVNHFVKIMWPELNSMTKTKSDKWKSTTKSKYRKTFSELTSYWELPEVLLSSQCEDEINFGKVASNEGQNGAQ